MSITTSKYFSKWIISYTLSKLIYCVLLEAISFFSYKFHKICRFNASNCLIYICLHKLLEKSMVKLFTWILFTNLCKSICFKFTYLNAIFCKTWNDFICLNPRYPSKILLCLKCYGNSTVAISLSSRVRAHLLCFDKSCSKHKITRVVWSSQEPKSETLYRLVILLST